MGFLPSYGGVGQPPRRPWSCNRPGCSAALRAWAPARLSPAGHRRHYGVLKEPRVSPITWGCTVLTPATDFPLEFRRGVVQHRCLQAMRSTPYIRLTLLFISTVLSCYAADQVWFNLDSGFDLARAKSTAATVETARGTARRLNTKDTGMRREVMVSSQEAAARVRPRKCELSCGWVIPIQATGLVART